MTLQTAFHSALAAELESASASPPTYAEIVHLARRLVFSRQPDEAVQGSRRVLNSLFPNWPPNPTRDGRRGLLYWFDVLFIRNAPGFSAKLNAWITALAGAWLMGPRELQDLDADADLVQIGDGRRQQLLVQRCRFLEEAKCASVCVNGCKLPTEAFFSGDMRLPVSIEPDYETLECRFKFGVAPTEAGAAAARDVACFAACPAAAADKAVVQQLRSSYRSSAASDRCMDQP